MEAERLELVRGWMRKAEHDDVMFARTHSIGQLVDQGLALDPGIGAFAFAESLSPYGVDIRYPDDLYVPSEKEAEDAFAVAVSIFRYVEGKVGATSR